MAQDGIPLGDWSGANATKQLEATIERIQLENSKQQGTMLKWTIISAACAFGAFVLSLLPYVLPLLH